MQILDRARVSGESQTSSGGPLVVIGASGKTGRRVLSRLRSRGYSPLAASRSGAVHFDWQARETWRNVLLPNAHHYLSVAPDLAAPGVVNMVRDFVDAARDARVKRLVLLSGRGEPEAEEAEEIVRQSGLEWTVLRCSWFAQNFSESFMSDGIRSGQLVLPAADIGEPFLHAGDIAEIAEAALTTDDHLGLLYELTGPRLLTFAQAVDEIASATGRTIEFVSLPIEEYAAGMAAMDVDNETIWLLSYLFSTVLDGRNASIVDGVERALGRPPRDFSEYVAEATLRGDWDAAPSGQA